MPTPQTWADGAPGSGFDVDHLPYGVFTPTDPADAGPRIGVRIGDHVLDLAHAARGTRPVLRPLVEATALNPLMAAGPRTWAEVRSWATDLLTDPSHRGSVALHPLGEVRLHLPVAIGDFVDFYASEHHAAHVGRLFRPDAEPLLPNWRHLPVGYHGRAGSIVVSGTDVRRPCGQRKDPDAASPTFGPSRRLDLEAEVGFVVGRTVPLGTAVPTAEFEQTVFGVVGLNDWSARDVQAWEYVPLGPHLGKSFATSISAWVTPLAALEPARVEPPASPVDLLPYLAEPGSGYDIDVEVEVDGEVIARPPYRLMSWTPAQMLAHLTVNGASLRVGDLFASGTVSGPEPDQMGCLLERYENRRFLDNDARVVLRYSAPTATGRLTLGEVAGTVVPAPL